MNRFLAVFLWLAVFPNTGYPADITVTGPVGVLKPNAYHRLTVTGIDNLELARATVSVIPDNEVQVQPMKTWADEPLIWFYTSKPGNYQITVSINEGISGLSSILTKIKSSGIKPELLQPLETAASNVILAYPPRSGICVLTITDPVPPPTPPVPPTPPTPVTEGKRTIVILGETEEQTPELFQMYVSLRNNPIAEYLQSRGHRLWILDDDHQDAQSYVTLLNRNKAAAGLPVEVVIVDAETPKLLYKGNCPPTAQGVLDLIKANGG